MRASRMSVSAGGFFGSLLLLTLATTGVTQGVAAFSDLTKVVRVLDNLKASAKDNEQRYRKRAQMKEKWCAAIIKEKKASAKTAKSSITTLKSEIQKCKGAVAQMEGGIATAKSDMGAVGELFLG